MIFFCSTHSAQAQRWCKIILIKIEWKAIFCVWLVHCKLINEFLEYDTGHLTRGTARWEIFIDTYTRIFLLLILIIFLAQNWVVCLECLKYDRDVHWVCKKKYNFSLSARLDRLACTTLHLLTLSWNNFPPFLHFFLSSCFPFFSLALFHSQTSRLGRKVFFFFINFLKWTFTTHEVVLLHCAEANQLHARLIYILAIKLCENFINFPEKLDKIEATENLFC